MIIKTIYQIKLTQHKTKNIIYAWREEPGMQQTKNNGETVLKTMAALSPIFAFW